MSLRKITSLGLALAAGPLCACLVIHEGGGDAASIEDAADGDHPTGDAGITDRAASDLEADDASTGADASIPEDAASGADAAQPADCQGLKDRLKAELGIVGSCTVVIRQAPYGASDRFQVVCGEYHIVDEAQARARAQEDTGFGAEALMLNPEPQPEDAFVFYDTPDTLGGAAAVSPRTGLTVFGATLDSENQAGNEITLPATWRPIDELGPGCHSSHVVPVERIRAYSLVDGTAISMPDEWPLVAAAELGGTVLLDAMAESGYIFDLVVLYYVKLGYGPGDTAENVLLLNGGWLE